MKMWIEPEISPFHRNWPYWITGWHRRLIWWLWPIRWVLVQQSGGTTVRDYYLTANDAALRMCAIVRDDLRGNQLN
jgi:hypothetical protein